MSRLAEHEAVELAAFVCGYTETEARKYVVNKYLEGDEEELNDKIYDKFEVDDFIQFWQIAESLLLLTAPVQSPLTGTYYHAFIKHDEGLALAKIEAAAPPCPGVKDEE